MTQVLERRDARIGQGAGLQVDDWRDASGPGIPLPQYHITMTTDRPSPRDLPDSIWEQWALEQRSRAFEARRLDQLRPLGTGGVVIGPQPQDRPDRLNVSLLTDGQLIARIRSSLSLQMKELAAAVGVQRPTVYAWLKGLSLPQRPNRDRLQWLYRLALRWEAICPRPLGEHLRRTGPDGRSLVEILSDPSAREPEVTRIFEGVARNMASEGRQRPPSIRSLAAKHGIRLENVKDQQDVLDVLTGKPFHED